MDVNVWNETYWWVGVIWNVLLILVPLLAAAAATSAFGASVIRTAKMVYREWVRPAINEPTDPLVKLLAEKTGLPAAVISAFLIDNLDLVEGLLPKEELATASKGKELLKKLQDLGIDV